MPATRLVSGFHGCKLGTGQEEEVPYQTSAHLYKIEETQKDMDQHILIHSLMVGVSSVGGRISVNTAKAEKIPGPQMRDEGTDSDKFFFLYKWSEYKDNSGLTGQ